MAVIAIGVRLRVAQPLRVAQIDTLGDVSLYFETDRTTVWGVGDCVTLHWDISPIKAIYWSNGPTVGTQMTQWCPTTPVAIPYFTIVLQDGRQFGIAPFDIETIRARLLIMLLPLALVAGWSFGLPTWIRRGLNCLHFPPTLRSAFSANGQLSLILIGLFVVLNAIVLFDAMRQPSAIGYDAEDHYANVRVIAEGRLPTKADSNEFFSPPVPYLAPALLTWIGNHSGLCATAQATCNTVIRKFGQLQNGLISLIASFLLLKLGTRLDPDRLMPRAVALFLFATLPVYYKTFAFMRGEPFIVLFMLLLCDLLLKLRDRPLRRWDALLIGIYGGAIALSRQWGVLVLAGIALWWIVLAVRERSFARRLLIPGVVAAVIALTVAGSYYLAMARQTGTALAFNRSAGTSDAGAHFDPPGFFTGLGGGNLFTYPVSPGLDGQAFPVFYSEIWGDYWGYFYLPRPPIYALLPADAVRYMGTVNAVSLLPTSILFAGFVYGALQLGRLLINRRTAYSIPDALFTLCILASVLGFGWFLVHYPSDNADTAKATYMLQIFPLLCLLSGQAIDRLATRWPKASVVLLIALVFVAVFNLPMLFTRLG